MQLLALLKTPEQREQYRREQAVSLTRINRIGALVGAALVAYLAFFSDPLSYPQFAHVMLLGRLFAMTAGVLVGVLSFIPGLRRFGTPFSFIIFLGAAFMMAHLTAVMNNEQSDVLAWILVSIIFCGIYPLPLLYSLIVVVLSFGYYVVLYFQSGYALDLNFRQTLINVGSASVMTLAFKIGLERIRRSEFSLRKRLEAANGEIASLNDKLKDENLRLSHEVAIAQHIQSIVLPQESEYRSFRDLQIACHMLPATEVGGDFYDTIHFGPGGFISIGDVTDHGLHSGLIMMMVHTALRALSSVERNDIQKIFKVINKLLYDFRLKTLDHRIMSLVILKYLGDGDFVMTGQHETLLIFRKDGSVEDIDSQEYGMYAGLDANISSHLKLLRLRLDVDDVLVLYTDGITEAMDAQGRQFEPAGIIEAVRPVRDRSAQEIQSAILDACEKHIGTARRYDDISVVVVRKLADPGWDGQMRGTVHVGDAIDTDHGIESTCSLRFLPLDMFDNWQRGSMVSDFTADYFRHNFPSEQQVGLISTVVNELVENAVKFTPKNSLPVELTFKKSKDSLIVEATNSVPSNRCLRFMTVCRELFERNLDDVYLERMDQNTKDASSSGLGLLLIKKDYSARLGFHFHFDDEGTVRVTVTTQLDFSEPEGGSHG